MPASNESPTAPRVGLLPDLAAVAADHKPLVRPLRHARLNLSKTKATSRRSAPFGSNDLTTRSKGAEPRRPHFAVASSQVDFSLQQSNAATESPTTRVPPCSRIIVMTQGHSSPRFAKTAIQLLRYRGQDVVAVLDSDHVGSTAQEVFGVGDYTPVIGSLGEAKDPDSLFVGIAPPGGRLPEGWSGMILQALRAGLTVVSGLHDRLSADRQLADAAERCGGRIVDLRTSDHCQAATAQPMRAECFRVLTVGTDCSVGKMSAAKEIESGLRRLGHAADFLPTGQTGVMIKGAGIVVDAVVSDFVNGAVERLVFDHQASDYLLVEGQGSIVHPAYSGVALGLLHGAAPHALVLCHELGREYLKSAPHVAVRPLEELIRLHEAIGSVRHPCKVVGLALNGTRLGADAAAKQVERVSQQTDLPACDVYRDGPDRLVRAIERHKNTLQDHRAMQPITEPAL